MSKVQSAAHPGLFFGPGAIGVKEANQETAGGGKQACRHSEDLLHLWNDVAFISVSVLLSQTIILFITCACVF